MVLLSFDTEEFDVPREHGVEWDTLKEGMEVSVYGANRILDCLKECGVRATFFCTTNFATHAPEVMRRIIDEGHEVAAHGCDHWEPKPEDVINSKRVLEQVCSDITAGKDDDVHFTVKGYRQPRMFPVSDEEIERQGYLYNSSLNPAFIPGRYMHLTESRTPFFRGKVLEIPASVTPWFRFPLFWLAMHNLPMWLYEAWCRWTWKHDGQFVTYFHPWEFYPLGEHPELKMPFIIKKHAGGDMVQRLGELIRMFKAEGASFITYSEFTEQWQKK